MLFLLALTVPSDPRPKNTARVVAGSSMSRSSYGRLKPETSSLIPTVNRGRGAGRSSSAKTPATIPGVNSFDASPYRPPVTSGIRRPPPAADDPAADNDTADDASASAASTSRNSGSPSEPGSLVRSSTATRSTEEGSAASSSAAGNGRNSRTWTTPTRSPRAARYPAVAAAVSAPGAHDHDHPLGLRVTVVRHQRVAPAGQR